nr:hypothetical protein [Rhodococcus sp. (in: high G+C Gram-positive bacteria)]
MRTTQQIVQAIVGLVLGVVFAWAGLQVIPVQSGASSAALTLLAALVLAAVVAVAVPRIRTAAVAFAVAAVLLTAAVFLVVV